MTRAARDLSPQFGAGKPPCQPGVEGGILSEEGKEGPSQIGGGKPHLSTE